MTEVQSAVTIGAVILGTMATRFLPFLVFPKGKTPPKFVQYLGKCSPAPPSVCWSFIASKTSPQAEPTAYRRFCRCC